MQMYYNSRTIKVHELLCCINGYAMRIEGKKFEFEDIIVWVFVMHSSVEMVTKRLYLQIGAQNKARFFSLMYFCESLCINRISHNYVIPQFLFCIIMPFRTSFHIPFRKLIPPFTFTVSTGGLIYCRPHRFFNPSSLRDWTNWIVLVRKNAWESGKCHVTHQWCRKQNYANFWWNEHF